MSLWPFIRSPFTDLTATIANHQTKNSRCGPMEMRVIDCLDAYGVDRGEIKCEALIKDFQECVGLNKQMKRFYRMRYERHRQRWAGERSKEEYYADPPKLDSY